MNKFDQIRLVRLLGLNSEESILIKHRADCYIAHAFLGKHTHLSLRTMDPTDPHRKTPHFPLMLKENLTEQLHDLLDQGFQCIVATPIGPEDTLYAGAVMLDGAYMTIELAKGPCTVRKVTHEGIIDISYDLIRPNFDEIASLEIREIALETQKVPFDPCVIEVSYYKQPVGIKKQNVIIWDITDAASEKTRLDMEETLARLTAGTSASKQL